MFPKKGNDLPLGKDRFSDADCAVMVASALKCEFEKSRHGAKIVMKWTGASNRTAKNWLGGTHAPSGANLLMLARQSDAVFCSLLAVMDRRSMAVAVNLAELRERLKDTIDAIDAAMDVAQT